MPSASRSMDGRDDSEYSLEDLEQRPRSSTSKHSRHRSSDNTPPSPVHRKKRLPRPACSIRLLALALGQLTIFGLALGFVATLILQSHIPLPDSLAHLAYSEPSATTFVVSIGAAIISMISIRIYWLAVRLALTNKLHKQATPLLFFGFSVKASSGSVFFSTEHPTWTCTSAVIVVLVGALGSGWTSLFNPTVILLSDPISGTELDLRSPMFANLLTNDSYPLAGTNNSMTHLSSPAYNFLDVAGPVAGHSAGGARLGLPSFFSLNGATYNGSTGGILPSITSSVNSVGNPSTQGLSFAGGNTRFNTTPVRSRGLSQNFTVVQQGLTADVSCAPTNSDSLSVETGQSQASDAPESVSYYLYSAIANCNYSSAISYSTMDYVTEGSIYSGGGCDIVGYVFIVPCPLQDTTAPSNNSFTIAIYSNTTSECRYSFIPHTICSVTPMITTVTTEYNDKIITPREPAPQSYPIGEDNPSAMAFLVSLVQWIGARAQNLVSNSVGDSVYILKSMPNQTDIQGSNDTIVNMILEDYWRGVIEYGGTYLRSGYSTAGSAIPNEMQTNFAGNVTTLTMGYTYRPTSTLPALLPQVLITILTLVVLAAAGREPEADTPQSNVDVTDVSDVVLATTANSSGIQGVPAGKEKRRRMESETVRLKNMDDGRKMLVLDD